LPFWPLKTLSAAVSFVGGTPKKENNEIIDNYLLPCNDVVRANSMNPVSTQTEVKVADEVWIAAALLHREHPEKADFTIEEIVDRARTEALTSVLRPGVYVHAVQHCVANRPPNPGRYRMLLETSPGRRRLFRKGDTYHPEREGGKITPRLEDLPHGYSGLLGWYDDWCSKAAGQAVQADPLLSLKGSGRKLWADEHADDYVRRLRERWE
jgi:hypothetical protein